VPRDLPVPGRDLDGVHFAMEYLYQRNRWVAAESGLDSKALPGVERITAERRHAVVIGGGDTGADCVGNAVREGALSVLQLELLPKPPAHRPDDRTPWPLWPAKFRLSYAMEEAIAADLGSQEYSVSTLSFLPSGNGGVGFVQIAQAAPEPPFAPIEGTERQLPADLVLLAMGFVGPEQALLEQLGVERDERTNVKCAEPYTTSVQGVFVAGDARRGQSLVVWAINEGRQCARMVDRHLQQLRDGRGLTAAAGRSSR
jgi:glutamate synthase (NADPH/NADH) small chain